MNNFNNIAGESLFGFLPKTEPIPKAFLDLKVASEKYPKLYLNFSGEELSDRHSPMLELTEDLEEISPHAYEKEAFSLIYLPNKNKLKKIGEYAFLGCAKLEDFVIPDEVEFIGEGAFAYCGALEHFELPNSLTSVDPFLLMGCNKLDMLTLHNNLKRISASAFIGCSALTVILFYGTEEEWEAIEWEGSRDIIADIPVSFAGDYRALPTTELSLAISRYLEVGEEIWKEQNESDVPYPTEKLNALYTEQDELYEKIQTLIKEDEKKD